MGCLPIAHYILLWSVDDEGSAWEDVLLAKSIPNPVLPLMFGQIIT